MEERAETCLEEVIALCWAVEEGSVVTLVGSEELEWSWLLRDGGGSTVFRQSRPVLGRWL